MTLISVDRPLLVDMYVKHEVFISYGSEVTAKVKGFVRVTDRPTDRLDAHEFYSRA